jgi:putative MATE family efflux protein
MPEENAAELTPRPHKQLDHGDPQKRLAKVDRLGTAKISKLITEFAIPSIIAMTVNGLYNIVDSVFMGRGIGDIGQATATVAMPTMVFAMAVSMLIGQGGNALVALRMGEGRKDEAEKIMGNCLSLLIIAGILCATLIMIFIDPLLSISGATAETWDSSHTFLRIIGAGVILQFISMGFNNFIRTAGHPVLALLTMLVGIFVATILNWLFVMHWGWGVAGSAWATLAGQAVSAVLVMYYFIFDNKAPFHIHLHKMPIKLRLVGSIFALGSASFVLQFAAAIINLLLNEQMQVLGAISPIGVVGAQATIGVVGRVAMLSFFPIMGVAVAAQPIFGYNFGARKFERVKKTFWVALIWIVALGMVFWLVIRIFPEQIASFFGLEGELLSFTAIVLQVQLFMIPVMGLQVLAANFFQSTGQPGKSLILSLTRQVIFMIPLMFILPVVMPMISAQFIPLDGLYWMYPICDITSALTAAALMAREFRSIECKIAARDAELAVKAAL